MNRFWFALEVCGITLPGINTDLSAYKIRPEPILPTTTTVATSIYTTATVTQTTAKIMSPTSQRTEHQGKADDQTASGSVTNSVQHSYFCKYSQTK